jgi:hypothetical protein
MRAILAAKSGSQLAFHVFVACHRIPALRRICRTVSVLISTRSRSPRCPTSLVRLQVVNGRPSRAGGAWAVRQTSSRTAGPNRRGRPPLHFGSNAANPEVLNAWITSRA